MNNFHAVLQGLQLSNDIENLTLRVTSGQQTTATSMSWFNGYLSSDFPQVVCDKKYFFLYSTDHSTSGGGIYWGKGDNLNLSDFQEVAEIFSGFQAETPYPLNVPAEICGDNETFHLLYHTTDNEPGNDGKQQTRLLTSSGGAELHSMVFTDRGRPLGIVGTENHTGYLMPYELSYGNYIGTHIPKGGLPQSWVTSTATNPRNWTRTGTVDTTSGVDNDYFTQLSEGRYFEKYGQIWWLGQIHPKISGGLTAAERILILGKADNIGGAVTHLKTLNNGAKNIRHSVRVTETTAHIYITNPVSKMYHATYNLENLQNYI